MIGYIKGILEEADEQCITVDNHGIGYRIFVPGSAFAGATMVDALKNSGKEVVLDENGSGEFVCLPNSVSVYIKK